MSTNGNGSDLKINTTVVKTTQLSISETESDRDEEEVNSIVHQKPHRNQLYDRNLRLIDNSSHMSVFASNGITSLIF